ncbi:discoidin domain-containing protein, partial [Clostridium tarantellae]
MYKPLSLSNESPPMPLPEPTIITAIDLILLNDNNLGTAVNQFNFSKGWNYEKLTEAEAYNSDNHWTIEVGATLTVTFASPKFHIVAIKDANHGIMTLSIDDGPEMDIDLYSSKREFKQIVYESSVLSTKEHKIVLKCSGRKNASAKGMAASIDAIFIEPMPVPTPLPLPINTTNLSLLNDGNIGTDVNQFNFSSGWNYEKLTEAEAYKGDNHWTVETGATLTVTFASPKFHIVAIKDANHGIMTLSIDDGAEMDIDLYSSKREFKQIVYESSVLSMKQHKIVIKCSGRKNTSAKGMAASIDAIFIEPMPIIDPIPEPMPIGPIIDTTDLILLNDNNLGTAVNQFNFSKGWNYEKLTEAEAYKGDNHWTVEAGATLTVTFASPKFHIVAIKDANHGIMTLSIDDGPEMDIDLYSSKREFKQIVYESSVLSMKQHKIVIKCSGRKNANAKGMAASIDAIFIEPMPIIDPIPEPIPILPPTPIDINPISPSINLALKKIAISSSNETNTLTPNYVTDGDTSSKMSRWSSGSFINGEQWIYVDLGEPTDFDTIKIYWEAANALIYRIETSTDATTWNSIYRTTNGQGKTEEISLLSMQKARFVRIYCEKNNSTVSPTVSIYEIEIFNMYKSSNESNLMPSPTNSIPNSPNPMEMEHSTNLAMKKPAMDSSNSSSAMYVTDGRTSRWSSGNFANGHQWIYVDLGAATEFDTVKIHWGRDYATIYKIETSNDATNWSSAYRTTNGQGKMEKISLDSMQNARFVRVYCERNHPIVAPTVSIYEIEIYNMSGSSTPTSPTTPPNPVKPSINLALKKPAMDSSNSSSAMYVTDGRTSRWSSGNFANGHQWIYVDLGTATEFDTVKIHWGRDYATIYRIETSNDATNWSSIYRTTNGQGKMEKISLSSMQNARFVRVYCERNYPIVAPTVSIYEIEICNMSGSSTPTSPTTPPNPMKPSTNLALKKPAMDSSNSSSAMYVTDGRTSRWSSGNFANGHQWIYVDLG